MWIKFTNIEELKIGALVASDSYRLQNIEPSNGYVYIVIGIDFPNSKIFYTLINFHKYGIESRIQVLKISSETKLCYYSDNKIAQSLSHVTSVPKIKSSRLDFK